MSIRMSTPNTEIQLEIPKKYEEDRVIERSPQGRYIRFDALLGSGAYKTVYKAYDTDQGIDVAWNTIDIGALPAGEKTRIVQEVQLLQMLEHKNIINFYGSWYSKEKNQVVFITEIMTSGTLKSYIKRVQLVKWKILKRWCIQILEGLQYLHDHNPPIIHRDLKCDNIFINGNTGDLRIGDLGLSTQMAVEQRAQSVLGTPEFMAPELYDENYTEKVDIYAFGMCVLEMVTKDVPYSECQNPAQIYKKVIGGIRPKGLQRVKSKDARDFIELCLSRGDGKVDVTSTYLLQHPFLQPSVNDDEEALADPLTELDAPALPLKPKSSEKELEEQLNKESFVKNDSFIIAKEGETNATKPLPNVKIAMRPLSGDKGSSLQPTYGAEKGKTLRSDNPPPSIADVVNEEYPIIETSADDHLADKILASMPGNESEIQNERMKVMDGRGGTTSTAGDSQCDNEMNNTVRLNSPVGPAPSGFKQSPNQIRKEVVVESSNEKNEKVAFKEIASAISNSKVVESTSPENPIAQTTAGQNLEIKNKEKSDVYLTGAGPILRKRGLRHDIKATPDLENEHSIILNLRISIDGKSKEIKFPFNVFTDCAFEVASELAVDVGILEPDLHDIVGSIVFLVTEAKSYHCKLLNIDVWEDAPEPVSFTMNFVSAPLGKSASEISLSDAIYVTEKIGKPPLQSHLDRESSVDSFEQEPLNETLRELEAKAAAAAFLQDEQVGASFKHETGSNSSLNASPRAVDIVTLSKDLDPDDPAYFQKMKDYEYKIRNAQSAFDRRELTLEAAMQSEKEKFQKEIEKYNKKMQQFELKKQKAQIARQQRLEEVKDEFEKEVKADIKLEVKAERSNLITESTGQIQHTPLAVSGENRLFTEHSVDATSEKSPLSGTSFVLNLSNPMATSTS